MPKSRISNVANMSFNSIHENKILAKIYEFTVTVLNQIFQNHSAKLTQNLFEDTFLTGKWKIMQINLVT